MAWRTAMTTLRLLPGPRGAPESRPVSTVTSRLVDDDRFCVAEPHSRWQDVLSQQYINQMLTILQALFNAWLILVQNSMLRKNYQKIPYQ